MRALALLAVVLPVQDPADQVRALVERLGSDEIVVRHKAERDLVKLGPAALPALRTHLAKAEGERRVALETIVGKLEREERLHRLLESPPVVSLDARDAVVEDVLADIARQTGLRVEGFMLDSTFKITASFERLPLWKALDEIGRIHGGLVTHYYPNRVMVEPGPRAGSPLVLHKGLGLHFRPALRTAGDAVELQAVINHAPGLPIWSTAIDFQELTDDRGKSLLERAPGLDEFFAASLSGPAAPKNFATVVGHRSRAAVSEGAVRIRRARGSATLGLALDLKRLLAIPAPVKDEEVSGSADGYGATCRATREGNKVTVMISKLTGPDANDAEDPDQAHIPRWTFAIRDQEGRVHTGRVSEPFWGGESQRKAEFILPQGTEIATFELVTPEKLTEVVIPFDFADLPIPPPAEKKAPPDEGKKGEPEEEPKSPS